MSFLAPLFLLGGAVIIGPIIFHLIRRTTREVTPFSSLMFLQPTPPRVTRRSRIENLWLLLLRCLVIGLLALGFGRPFLQREDAAADVSTDARKRTVLLVDTSASMRREDLWTQARTKVETLARKAAPQDEMALLTFDRTPRTLLTFEQWQETTPDGRVATLTQRLEGVTPGWAGTTLGTALLQAAEMLEAPAEANGTTREIIVIGDLQEGSRLDGLQGYEWPRGLIVRLEPVTAKRLENAGAQWIAESVDSGGAELPQGPRIRVINTPDAKREQFALTWAAAAQPAKLDVYVPAGQARVARPSPPPSGSNRLVLTGDEVEFDNTLFILPAQPVQVPLLYVGNDANEDTGGSFYYLARAFQKTPALRVEVSPVRGNAPVPAFRLQQSQMIVLGEGVEETALQGVREFARAGKIVLAPLASAEDAQTVARLLETPAFTATEARVKDYAMFAQIDFQHPIFAAFADPRFSDFTKIHFWKYRRIDSATLPGARVVASFDDKAPAIIEAPLGKGRVVILTSTWRPADSQLALSSKFVPLLYGLLEQSSNLPPRKAQYFVGDEVPLPPGPQSLTVRKPDGGEVPIPAGGSFKETDQPGVYQVMPGTLRFVVNLTPDESKLAALGSERLSSLGVPLAATPKPASPHALKDAAKAQAAELESRQKLWRWLVIAALVVLLLETLLAGRLTRFAPSTTGAQT